MIKFIFFLCLCISHNFGANIDYYQIVNKANRAIYLNDFDEAKKQLDLGFSINSNPYHYDVYKWILCNSKSENKQENTKWLSFLVLEKKIPPTLLKHKLASFLTTEDVRFLDSMPYEASKSKIKTLLLDMIKKDQAIRDFSSCGNIYDENQDSDKNCLKKLFARRDSLDEVHAKEFVGLMEKYGLPSENDLGVYLKGDVISSYNQLFYILGIHFAQTSYRAEIVGIYNKALDESKFHPELYGSFHEFIQSQNFDFGKRLLHSPVSKVDERYYKPFIVYTESTLDSINENRLKIGLDSIHINRYQVLSDILCPTKRGEIKIISFPNIVEVPYWLVKGAFEKENRDLDNYLIDLITIKSACEKK